MAHRVWSTRIMRHPLFADEFTRLSDRWLSAVPGRTLADLSRAFNLDQSHISHYRAGRFCPDSKGGFFTRAVEVFALTWEEAVKLYESAGIDVGGLVATTTAGAA